MEEEPTSGGGSASASVSASASASASQKPGALAKKAAKKHSAMDRLNKQLATGCNYEKKEEKRVIHRCTSALDGHQLTWYWTDDLNLTVAGVAVAPHAVHGRVPASMENDLYAAYTVVRPRGATVSSAIYGPYVPGDGGGTKEKHSERGFAADLGDEILAAAKGALAIVVEINQTNSPCSGPAGCAVFMEKFLLDVRTNSRCANVVGRFSALQKYEGQLMKTHPTLAPAAGTTQLEVMPPLSDVAVVHKNIAAKY
jgi:hypothetical protein